MKKGFLAILLSASLLTGCQDPNREKIYSVSISPMGENAPISGGASEGNVDQVMFGFTGQFRSYLNSDIARVPVKINITFSKMNNEDKLKETYFYDVFLQKAEVIDIINNGSLKNLHIVYGTTFNNTICYSLLYGNRQVEYENPGKPAQWCRDFR